jgi:hypothetical protein
LLIIKLWTQLAEGVKIKLETFLALTTEGGGQLYLPAHFRHSDGNDEDM